MSKSPTLAGLDPAPTADQPKQHAVTIHVNERPVQLAEHLVTGLEIKQVAIAQGVPIEVDFILVEELGGGRTKVIGNQDRVHVDKRSRFLANDGDDNS
jgi:hypothetical protein